MLSVLTSFHSFAVKKHYCLASARHGMTSLFVVVSIWFPLFSIFIHADVIFTG